MEVGLEVLGSSSADSRDLLASGAVHLHNSTVQSPQLVFSTHPSQCSYAVSLGFKLPPAEGHEADPVVVVEVEVLDGRIGLGVLDEAMLRYVSSEVDVTASDRPIRIELRPHSAGVRVHLMVRNTAGTGAPSRFRLRRATLEFKPRDRGLLIPRDPPELSASMSCAQALTGEIELLVSHTSRSWNSSQCDRGYLEARFAKVGRLDNPPLFDSLPPNLAPYHGLLSLLRLRLTPDGAMAELVRHYESPEKIVHAAIVGSSVVACFDAGVARFARRAGSGAADLIVEGAERLSDPWFGGLHTVMPVDEVTCLVSSSGADAVLWLDLQQKKVVRRWRLPPERYGTNYQLDETTWLSEHYIPNDLQLGHLNCASPDGEGGAFVSVLGQGDIGHVDRSGNYQVLLSGFVGCHGVRCAAQGGLTYFCDSCTGRLMRLDGKDRATTLFETGSRWLHDAVHLAGGLFLLALGDQNRLVLADVNSRVRVAEWELLQSVGTVQFLSVTASALAAG